VGFSVRRRMRISLMALSAFGMCAHLASARADVMARAAVDCPVEAASRAIVQGRQFDAHTLALIGSVVCRDAELRVHLRVLDAMALLGLDELEQGRSILSEVLLGQGAMANAAGAALALDYVRAHEPDALATLTERLPKAIGNRATLLQRIDAAGSVHLIELDPDERRLAERYFVARHAKTPWLAGVFSAILPGAGQAYAGSWQGAAVAFFLNAVFIAATVELVRNDLYGAGVATGVAGSFFYFGSIINAADLAARHNAATARPHWEELEKALLPEAFAPTETQPP